MLMPLLFALCCWAVEHAQEVHLSQLIPSIAKLDDARAEVRWAAAQILGSGNTRSPFLHSPLASPRRCQIRVAVVIGGAAGIIGVVSYFSLSGKAEVRVIRKENVHVYIKF